MLYPYSWRTIVSGLTVAAMMSLAGCSDKPDKKETPAKEIAPSNTEISPVFPDEQVPSDIKNEASPDTQADIQDEQDLEEEASSSLLELWRSGDHDRAADLFVNTPWLEATTPALELISRMTERQFAALPEAERNQKKDEMWENSRVLHELVRYVIDQGTQTMESGQYDESEKCFIAVRDLGKRISTKDLNSLSRMLGIGYQRVGLFKLIELYRLAEQETKLQEAQEDLEKAENAQEEFKRETTQTLQNYRMTAPLRALREKEREWKQRQQQQQQSTPSRP